MLKWFPNGSVILEQIHIFKTSMIAELAVSWWERAPSAGTFERSVRGDSDWGDMGEALG